MDRLSEFRALYPSSIKHFLELFGLNSLNLFLQGLCNKTALLPRFNQLIDLAHKFFRKGNIQSDSIHDELVKSQHHPSTGSGLRVNPAKRGITY